MYALYNYLSIANLKSIEIVDNNKSNDEMVMKIKLNNSKFIINNDAWCYASSKDTKNFDWVKAKNKMCTLSLKEGNYYIYLKNKYGYIKSVAVKDVDVNKIKSLEFTKSEYFIPVSLEEEFKVNVEMYGFVDSKVEYTISDDSIVKIESNKFIALKPGDATVTANIGNKKVSTIVHVMDSLKKMEVVKNRPYLSCDQFSLEEAHLLDKALESRVKEAGYKTRAGAVAAARFLGMEFSYQVPYFYENGRLKNYDVIRHVDGEGRYYHKGLYLSTDKFETIEASFKGPVIWGCPLMNLMEEGRYKSGVKYPNGLDCSGFISWALYNGGFDIGDVGAGDNPYRSDDLYDLGTLEKTSMDLLNSGKVKVGDLIAYWGHMAMIVGIDDNNLYVAESLPYTRGPVVKKYTKTYAMDLFENIMLMDDVYKEEGNLTNMW